MTTFALSLSGVTYGWKLESPLLDVPEFAVERGERVMLMGPSGSGKSTLLGLIAGVSAPQAGEICVLGERLDQMRPAQRDAFRAEHLGVIFQLFNLVPYLTPVENVVLPTLFSAARRAKASGAAGSVRDEALRLLGRLGLDSAHAHKPALELSVGQQQRVAAARALIGRPGLVIADEPTSALDATARDVFLELLSDECARSGATLLFVSHDVSLAPRFQRSVDLLALNRCRPAA
ncbi:ATP-binding cassette domain-containing protein [Hyphobacterium sp.]|jgi:putative ABC transport system ATP-binding protein|uniref:ATP-binding cassette domain-containing protein n=1 Tax=Hyphobacterium sp. TaxID=2004662 RepID=UPI003BAD9526